MQALVIDNGEYTGFAERLAQHMDVAYFSPWARAYPLMRQVFPGYGLPNVERIDQPLTFLELYRPDVVVLPDLYQTDLDSHVRKLGIPTFGSGGGTPLETDRSFLEQFLRDNQLPVIESEDIIGTEALKEYLQNPRNEDKFVKLSTFRGDFNTFHHKRWISSSVAINELVHELGPMGKRTMFIVQQSVPNACELSIEGIFIDGTLLKPFLVGYEVKDSGEIAHFDYYPDALPPQVQAILKALSTYFAEVHYRNFFAIEIRITEQGEAFLLDVACRVPIPPGASLAASILNLGEVVRLGGKGIPVPLDIGDTQYIAEMELCSPWTIQEFLQVHCDDESRERLSLRQHCQIDDALWCIPRLNPNPEIDAFGAAFGLASTINAACKECVSTGEAIDAYQMYYASDFENKAKDCIKQGAKLGIEFQ